MSIATRSQALETAHRLAAASGSAHYVTIDERARRGGGLYAVSEGIPLGAFARPDIGWYIRVEPEGQARRHSRGAPLRGEPITWCWRNPRLTNQAQGA